jgi:thioredoxin 1
MRTVFNYCAPCLVLFGSVVSADDLLIFSAEWCGPCQSLKAAIEKDPNLVAEFSVHLIDIDENPDAAVAHNVKTVPTLLQIMQDGKTRKKVGFTSPADLKQWLQKKN